MMNLDAMRAKAAELPDRQRRFTKLLLKYAALAPMVPVAQVGNGDTPALLETLEWRDGMAVNDVFQPGSDAYLAVEALIGQEQAGVARKMWERAGELP